jgi:thiamine-monophosphate kinase
MDISDGLARSVRLLAKRSGVGAEVELERVPRSPRAEELCERLGASLEEAVLGGGDELESLLAVPPRRLARARREVEGLAVVGRVTGRRGRCELVREGGRGPLQMAGWST